MEKRIEDLPLGENLAFATNPFEIKKNLSNNTEQKKFEYIEDYFILDPPLEIRPIKLSLNFPKSNFSQLTFAPPFERKPILEHSPSAVNTKLEGDRLNKKVEREENRSLKEDFDTREFIKLDKWFLLLNTSTEKAVLCGFRNDLEEVIIQEKKCFINTIF